MERFRQRYGIALTKKKIAGDHPDADGLGSGVCLFLSGIH